MKLIELLSDGSKWTQETYARDASGYSVQPMSDSAVCWCLAGAIVRCYKTDPEILAVEKALRNLLPSTVPQFIVKWQDSPERSYAEIHTILSALAEQGY